MTFKEAIMSFLPGDAKVCKKSWNKYARLELTAITRGTATVFGPWARLYDIGAGVGGGLPIDLLVAQVDDNSNGWLPWEPPSTELYDED